MVIEDTLFILFRRVYPEKAIKSWINIKKADGDDDKKPLCLQPDKISFYSSLQNQFTHYSVNEAEYAYKYAEQTVEYCSGVNTGVFGLLAESVKELLTTDIRNECLCNYKCLLKFRELTHPIDPIIFQAAFLAKKDLNDSFERKYFSWPLSIHTNNNRLYHILDKGMAENHFHVSGSSNAFQFSWICLMNNYNNSRKKEFNKENFDKNQLDSNYSSPLNPNSYFLLTFKAVCIRLFLFLRLRNQWVKYSNNNEFDYYANKKINDDWLEQMLRADESNCEMYISEVNDIICSLKKLCKPDKNGFVADYALMDEPFAPLDDFDEPFYQGLAVRNYERRLFYPLAGEQRFIYSLLKSIYKGDPEISPYLDIAYAYLLIYCKIRSELVQINNRVGFGNFLEYQDRKEIFTDNYPEYKDLRNRISQQSVLLNPQIVSFEGRLCPAKTPEKLIKKIEELKNQAENLNIDNYELQKKLLDSSKKKLHYVLHFPKKHQEYSLDEEELLIPRDYDLRKSVRLQSNAVIEARRTSPTVMSVIRGIDACSNEIDCRPEVFAPDFRHMRQQRYATDEFMSKYPLPSLKITYHAGEDFLDPLDGIRAIDEAVSFLEMQSGDRIGHALALGIDCEEWYHTKHHTVLLKKQALLDNLSWLYGKMHHYNIYNTSAEDHIFKWFKKLYTDIFTNSLLEPTRSLIYSVDVMDYYASLNLRGNDPFIYFYNPEGTKENRIKFEEELINTQLEPWKIRTNAGLNYDPISNVIYHHYHFNNKAKFKSDERVEYYVPKCIIDAVCMVQEKMQYDISFKNICVECNPSSNFLIGTFKDYLKHPIFKFNNKFLYSPMDKRYLKQNPRISASINTDDLGIFDTSLENEYALMACALEKHNEYCSAEEIVLPDNIYSWLDYIRQLGCEQSFMHISQ